MVFLRLLIDEFIGRYLDNILVLNLVIYDFLLRGIIFLYMWFIVLLEFNMVWFSYMFIRVVFVLFLI